MPDGGSWLQGAAAPDDGAPAGRDRIVLGLEEVDGSEAALVGGKCAQLGALARVEGVRVPGAFCVTTVAFRHVVRGLGGVDDLLEQLSSVGAGDHDAVRTLSAELRSALEAAAMPDALEAAIVRSLTHLGRNAAYAVRSSATAEDSPGASFAGQHDTYLNVVGPAAVLRNVRRCWASLYTERAVSYRLRNGIDHRKVAMAVIVQQMVFPQSAGVLFTADPVTSNRNVSSIEASFGLAQTLVSGLVTPDVYTVRDGRLVAEAVAAKQRAVHASPAGGTVVVPIERRRQRRPALNEAQIVHLDVLGRRVEARFGRPQDIEWCLDEDGFKIVQSRPITALFPIPHGSDDGDHVYVSVGHQQMMTDAMKPLGLSIWQLTAARPMFEAGGRLFVDVARELASAQGPRFVEAWERSDPLTGAALRTIHRRADLVATPGDDTAGSSFSSAAPVLVETAAAAVAKLVRRSETAVARVRREIRAKSGSALLDYILADVAALRASLSAPPNPQVIRAAMDARSWLDEHMGAWLGEERASDELTRSVPGNVTSEMGLALLDLADVIRPHPEVVALLRDARGERFLDDLPGVRGGRAARDAIDGYLDRYGMRCVGEIDITRPRWSEQPSALLPLILSHVERFEPGARMRRVEQGREESCAKEADLLRRVSLLPGGRKKARETKAMIDRLRTLTGYREYPKYHIVSRYLVYKRALLEEAERLVASNVLRSKEDIFYLRLEELRDVTRTGDVDEELVGERMEAFLRDRALTPPRVITSDGEVVAGTYGSENVPPGALVGLPVSGGTVEGRARVVGDVTRADLGAGDILVTAFTDPCWTPLFVAAGGLVTEVGGLMTHGAVIAREYGLPAVVGVEDATRLIRDGQRVRVHGAEGYVEILS